ncbi:MAG: GNAT family N-acetyltransferase [Christensenellaceae bacterium]|jgi:GNAT superfamily N-acetyltransferase
MDFSRVDHFWAHTFFGCDMGAFQSKENIVCPHQYLQGYAGAFILHVYEKYVFSVPQKYLKRFQKIAAQEADIFDETVLSHDLKTFQYIGPCWLGYANKAPKETKDDSSISIEAPSAIKQALNALKESCSADDWANSGIDENSIAVAVKYHGDKIVAAADYHMWGEAVAHIGIITHPAFRGKGYAKEALRAITREILQKGLLPQYRTLLANKAARNVAEAYGFQGYGTHISLRLP